MTTAASATAGAPVPSTSRPLTIRVTPWAVFMVGASSCAKLAANSARPNLHCGMQLDSMSRRDGCQARRSVLTKLGFGGWRNGQDEDASRKTIGQGRQVD